MMVAMIRWLWLLIVIVSRLRLAIADNGTATPTEVVPSSEYYVEIQTEVITKYTEVVEVTAEFDDANESSVFQDSAKTEVSVPSTVVHEDDVVDNKTRFENKTLQRSGKFPAYSDSTENETSTNQTGRPLTVKPSTTLQSVILTTHATETEVPTNKTLQEYLSTILESVGSTTHLSSSSTPTSKPLNEVTTVSNYVNSHANLSTTGALQSKNVIENLLSSLTNSSSSNETAKNSTTKITSTSSVPQSRLLTTPYSSETTYFRETSTERTSTFEVTSDKLSEFVTEDNKRQTTAELPVKHGTPDFVATGTEAIQNVASARPVTEDVTTTDVLTEDEDEYVDEDGNHIETEYERSLRTRRVINHAALWITIGFVVVLVSYITALVIYNRTRPDWQDSLRPYSRFENEPDDLPEFDQNNMEYENHVTEEYPQHESHREFTQHENRRDFSQCVDPRDFSDDGSHEYEYLLYEDPSYIDQATCTDFTYHDQC